MPGLKLLVLCPYCLLASAAAAAAMASYGNMPEQQPPVAFPGLDRAQRQSYIDRFAERILFTNIRPWWVNNTIDCVHGGFNINHDLEGTFLGPADKMVVTQCRETWFFAHLALFHQQQQAVNVTARQGEYREDRRFAEHGFAFLQTRLWDARGGGFWWLVASDGTPRSAGPEGFKDLYGQAFGLYALSYYHMATGDAKALGLATELFRRMHTKCYDTAHGGFHEAPRNDWSIDPSAFAGAIHRPTPKTINTHLHILEAFAAFYRALRWGNRAGDGEEGGGHQQEEEESEEGLIGTVEGLLRELLGLVMGRVIVEPQGTLFEFYAADLSFAPLPPGSAFHRSHTGVGSCCGNRSVGVGDAAAGEGEGTNAIVFGHVNELAWLVVDTCELLGIDVREAYGEVLSRLWAYSTSNGWDRTQGAFNNKQSIGGPNARGQEARIPDEKVWWVQCESLTAAAKLSRALGLPTLDVFDNILSYLEGSMIDWARGEWHAEVKNGKPQGAKAGPWKGPYHNARAIMLCLEELRRGL